MTTIHYDADYERNTPNETFLTRAGTIDTVLYVVEALQTGVKSELRLHVVSTDNREQSPIQGMREFTYRNQDDITALLQDFGVKKPEELRAKRVTVYLQQSFWKAGISVPHPQRKSLPIIQNI